MVSTAGRPTNNRAATPCGERLSMTRSRPAGVSGVPAWCSRRTLRGLLSDAFDTYAPTAAAKGSRSACSSKGSLLLSRDRRFCSALPGGLLLQSAEWC
jgi:hypothetical protein